MAEMNDRKDPRAFQNSSFDNRYHLPFHHNPSTVYIPNSAHYQPVSFQMHYYPPQPLSLPFGIQYGGPGKNHVLPNTQFQSHYSSIPIFTEDDSKGHRQEMSANMYPNAFQSSDKAANHYEYTYSVGKELIEPGMKPSELQVSAQAFVPHNTEDKSPQQKMFNSIPLIEKNVNSQIAANSPTQEPVHTVEANSKEEDTNVNKMNDDKDISQINNQRPSLPSTRPKEFHKGKVPDKKRNWSSSKPGQNWQNRENQSYNQAYNNQVFNPNVAPSLTKVPQQPLHNSEAGNYSNVQYQNYENRRYNYDSINGFNSRNRKAPIQNRQNYNPKKSEWRRFNEQNYCDNYDNQYYESENNNQQPNNYNNRGFRRYMPNERMKDKFNTTRHGNKDNREIKDKYIKEWKNTAGQGDRENRENKYIKEWNQYSQQRPNYLPHRNGSTTNFEYHKNDYNLNSKYHKNNYHKNNTASSSHPSKGQADVISLNVSEVRSDKDLNKIETGNQDDEKMQRENMIELLTKGIYECMVCCERIKQQQAIWSCNKCFNCFHLGCIKKWAGTSQGEPGWRCPACQNLNSKVPSGYFCFCKKLREPEWNRKEIPHSCGEVCGKQRENEWCTHKCTNLCHPGPCPDCSAFIKRYCQCGKNSKEVRCSMTEPFLCEEKCDHSLNCCVHKCERLCHSHPCEACSVIIRQKCFCGKEEKCLDCTPETASGSSFSCNSTCGKKLSCGNHTCEQVCHPGPCSSCSRAVEAVTSCPCGKMSLDQFYKEHDHKKRGSCLDTVPTCLGVCGKTLKCGTPGSYHTCESKCHEDPCPPCQEKTAVKCRCGFMDKKIPCVELLSKADEVTCEKQCKKLRQCGRHKCGMKCCIDIDHLCTRVCGRALKCRLHKCQDSCHRGNCSRCWETSFEELSCHCGASVLYPPIPCGTEPPACELSCRRKQSCSHPVSHTCHSDPKCPPCTTLISKPCFGNHTTMKSTPCYVSAMSCGEQCAKKLKCGVHLCQRVCHDGPCIKGGTCTQKCTEPRPSCGHPCANPCHFGICPDTPCKATVTVSCVCGNRKVEMVCSDNEKEYKTMATSKLASELHTLNSGGSIDISQIFSGTAKPEKLKRLECNDDCGLIERNRKLALALQITNPDSREFLGEGSANLFSESVKEEARKDINFAQMVHAALNDLVLKAKQSKQKSRSHSFAPMNRDKRRFIHEYSKYFSCQSQSYDEEPKKNVVVTACRNMSHLPPVSVVSVIQKELGQRKAPGPVLSRKALTNDDSGSLQMRSLAKNGSLEKKESFTSPKEAPPIIDYFDFS